MTGQTSVPFVICLDYILIDKICNLKFLSIMLADQFIMIYHMKFCDLNYFLKQFFGAIA